MLSRVLLLSILGAAIACSGGASGEPTGPTYPTGTTPGGTTQPPGGSSPADTATTNEIDVGDDFFTPRLTRVSVGTRVTWTWRGSNNHDVVLPGGTRSPAQSRGTFSNTFTAAGVYPYNCSLHSGMTGTVIVR
jgi:plastocyanin